MFITGENDQKYLSSSDGINTYSTGAKTSEHKPSVQMDNIAFNGNVKRSSKT